MDEDRKHPRATRVGALRDLLAISLTTLALFVLGSVTDAFESVHAALQRHGPGTEDDVLLALVLIVFASCAFGLLRRRRAGRPAGPPALVQDVMQDVTESRQAEEKLREAEARYRTLVERVPAVTYIWDAAHPAGSVAAPYISPQIESLLGFSPDEWQSDPLVWHRQVHAEDRDRILAIWAESDRTGRPFGAEYRIFTKAGDLVWVRDEAVAVSHDESGRPHFQGVMIDITERKRAEERMREAELRYRMLVERLPAVVYIDALDDVSTALYVSPRYEQLLGYTAEERMADPEMWLRLIHPDDRRWVQAESKRTNETGDPFIVEYRMLAKDGRVVWVRDEAVIVRDESGAPLYWQGVLLDITKRKQAEEGLSRRDGILEAVGFAAERFLKTHRWEETIPPVLERLGSAAGVSRAYLFENRVREDGERSTALRFEWTASGIGPSINEPNHARTTYRENGFGRWEDVLSAGGVIYGLPRGFPESERPELAMEGILSMAVVPVFVGDDWWGFLGFDECLAEREWPAAELDALRTAADTLGAAIGRERAERLQAETEARYRSLVENLPAVTYVDIVDERSTTIYVSPQVEEILGYATQEWLADDELWVRNLHPDDRDQIVEAARQHNTIGEPFDVEYRFRAKDGRWLWIHDEATIERDHAGRPRFSQGVMFDITERRVAEEQLRETEAKYRALVEHIPAVLYVDPADPDGPTMYVSPQAEEVLGIDRERYLADPGYWLEMIDAEDRERILEAYHDSLERREGWAVEYRIIRPSDGHVIWLRDESAYLPGGEGRPDLVQGVMADITERKLAEEALQQSERREREAAERLRALDEMKNTFLAAVSHELRSPLTSILGLSLTLEQQDLTAEDRGDLLGRLASNSRKLDRLLKDLLDIDRLNRGIVTPQYRATDVGALVRRTVDSLDILADRSVLVEAEAVVVPVDPAKVERIVENLLANAVRHTSADSGIWVLVVPQDGGVQISVEDDGSGVPKELQQAIFEPFLQGPTASPHSPGTGIGLSLVALFAELHGGRAWVEDREGGGASFRVFLPGTPSNGEPRALREEPAVGSGTRG